MTKDNTSTTEGVGLNKLTNDITEGVGLNKLTKDNTDIIEGVILNKGTKDNTDITEGVGLIKVAENKTGTSKLVFELYKNHSVFFLYYVIIMFRRCLSCSDFIATICQPSFFVLGIIFIMSCLVDLS